MENKKLSERLVAARAKLSAEEFAVAQTCVELLSRAGVTTDSELGTIGLDISGPGEVRDAASRAAGLLDVHSAGPALARALADVEDDTFTWAAANDLVRLNAKEATPILIKVLETGAAHKQSAAAYILGWLRERNSSTLLRSVAMDPARTVDVRAHAIEALGVIAANDALPELLELLSRGEPELRYWAAYSLGMIGDPTSIAALEHVASTDRAILPDNKSIREEALEAIESIRRANDPKHDGGEVGYENSPFDRERPK